MYELIMYDAKSVVEATDYDTPYLRFYANNEDEFMNLLGLAKRHGYSVWIF